MSETGKGFNLAAALAGVSKLDTSGGAQQIEYIDIGLLDGDPRNRRDLRGLEELAANIELLGLRQPLRVRENPDAPGRFIIVSGHRRRAALQRLVDDGGAEFAQVPCIRDNPAQSSALQELRLIFDNLDTQPYSDAEKAKLAARVEELLYLLKEEGLEFPGRMRDQVAAACKISAPKLARLKIIREKLVPEYMGLFEKDKLPEQAAYALARLPEDFQKRLANALSEAPSGSAAEKVLKKYNEGWRWEPELQCPDGNSCKRGDTFLRRDCEAPGWASWCGGQTCCLECKQAKADCAPCERMCSKAKARRKSAKDEAAEAAHKRKQKAGRKYQKETQVYAKRLLPAIDAAGLPEDEMIRWNYSRYTVAEVRRWAAGEFDDPAGWYQARLTPGECKADVEMSQLLGCSTDFLMGLTDNFRPPAGTEQPPQEGPALETDGTEAGEDVPASEETTQDVSNLDTISDDEPEEVPARRIRWESRGRTPPEGKTILTYEPTNDGPVYRAVVWKEGQFKFPNGKKFASGLQFTKWLEVPPPASGEEFQLDLTSGSPPEPSEAVPVGKGGRNGAERSSRRQAGTEWAEFLPTWMPGGTFPREPCEVVADLKDGKMIYRQFCRFDGETFLMGHSGVRIDAECVRWMAPPPVEDDVSKLDTSEEECV